MDAQRVDRPPARLRGRPGRGDRRPPDRPRRVARRPRRAHRPRLRPLRRAADRGGVQWLSPPFLLTVDRTQNGDIARGRGVSDDKGPVLLVVAMLQAAIAQRGGLPLNVKFLIEGEEEIGSPHLPRYVRRHARELGCDLVISADGAQWRPDEPSLSVASKGLVGFTITVEGARDDLHSGRYGGTVANPVHVLVEDLGQPARPCRRGRRARLLRRGDPAKRGAASAAGRGAVRRRPVRGRARRPRDVRRARVLDPATAVGPPDPGGERGDGGTAATP